MDVGDDSAAGDGRLDQGVQLLVSSDGQLQMPRGDPLHLQILGRVAGQLKHLDIVEVNTKYRNYEKKRKYLSGEVLQDGRAVDSGGGSNPARGECPALQMTVDPEKRDMMVNSKRIDINLM